MRRTETRSSDEVYAQLAEAQCCYGTSQCPTWWAEEHDRELRVLCDEATMSHTRKQVPRRSSGETVSCPLRPAWVASSASS